jgi:2-dehydropantoate 2-reductase
MRILVVGAGAVGGYFGGRLLQAGQDVTFLVRPGRATALAERGLTIRSRLGDVLLPHPPTLTSGDAAKPFDLILLSCKAYDLEDAMDSIAPMMGENTAILPLLNGMTHLETLSARFGGGRVLGGLCLISTTLTKDGDIVHLNDLHSLVYGERDGARSARVEAIESAFAQAAFDARLSGEILLEMWEKWVFIASAAGITCLMRSSIGDIVAAGAGAMAMDLLAECAAIAAQEGFALRPAFWERARTTLSAPGSPLNASMLRDIEAGGRVECEQVLGDLLRRAAPEVRTPVLHVAYLHVRAYEARRQRGGLSAA